MKKKTVLLSHSTRKRNRRIAEDICKSIQSYNLSVEDQIDVMSHSLRKLGIYKNPLVNNRSTMKGRKFTSYAACKAFWDFWHSERTLSTLTSRATKWRIPKKRELQSGLDFVDTETTEKQRNKGFYISNWCTLTNPFKQLFQEYVAANPNHLVSWGTFFALTPRGTTTKDIEIYCYKLHLHARWVISDLLTTCKQQKIYLGKVSDYNCFLNYITAECEIESNTYIS